MLSSMDWEFMYKIAEQHENLIKFIDETKNGFENTPKLIDDINSDIQNYKKTDDVSEKDPLEALQTMLRNYVYELCETMFSAGSDTSNIIEMWDNIEDLAKPVSIMVCGKAGSGKSKFINSLVGRELLKVDTLPSTAIVSKLMYSEENKLCIHLKDGTDKFVDFSYLKALNSGSEKSNKLLRKLESMDIYVNKRILQKFTIYDVPGFNPNIGYDEKIDSSIIAEADIVLFVMDVEQTLSKTEIEYIRSLPKNLKPIVIVNKIDALGREEHNLNEIIGGIRDRLGGHVVDVIGVSAQLALQGLKDKSKQVIVGSNLQNVMKLINQHVANKRDEFTQNRLAKLIDLCFDFGESGSIFAEYINEIDKRIDEQFDNSQVFISIINNCRENLKDLKEFSSSKAYPLLDMAYCMARIEDDAISFDDLFKLHTVSESAHYCIKNITEDGYHYFFNMNINNEMLQELRNSRIDQTFTWFKSVVNEKIDLLLEIENRLSENDEATEKLSLEIEEYAEAVRSYNNTEYSAASAYLDEDKIRQLEKWKERLDIDCKDLVNRHKALSQQRKDLIIEIVKHNNEFYKYFPDITQFLASVEKTFLYFSQFVLSFVKILNCSKFYYKSLDDWSKFMQLSFKELSEKPLIYYTTEYFEEFNRAHKYKPKKYFFEEERMSMFEDILDVETGEVKILKREPYYDPNTDINVGEATNVNTNADTNSDERSIFKKYVTESVNKVLSKVLTK